ncbi:MAG: hypothetical protein ACAH17_01540 [Candidatus Paceibacterota bacterium]
MDKQIKVTFKSVYKAKEGRKWVEKTSLIVETMNATADYKLRAMALNWQVVSVEAA